MKYLLTAITALSLVGCASGPVVLQVNTQPPGAYVTEPTSGLSMGVGPVVASYPKEALAKMRDASGCRLVKGFRAQWVSGATKSTEETIRLCGAGDSFAITISRDPDLPGLEKDLDFALRLSNASAAQQQAAAAEMAAGFQFIGATQRNAPVNCLTTPVGKSIQTNCR